MTVSEETRRSVWDGQLEIAQVRQLCYDMQRNLQKRVRSLEIVLASAGVGAFSPLLNFPMPVAWQSFVAPISGAIIAVLVIVHVTWNGTQRLAQVRVLGNLVAMLEVEYRLLWERVQSKSIEEQDALATKKELLTKLTQFHAYTDFCVSQKVSRMAHDKAFIVEGERYDPRYTNQGSTTQNPIKRTSATSTTTAQTGQVKAVDQGLPSGARKS